MLQSRLKIFDNILSYTILTSIVILPSLSLSQFTFQVTLSDLLLPLVILSILIHKWYKPFRPLYWLIALSAFILLTIVVNRTYNYPSNFFEVYKLCKSFIFFLFFKNMLPHKKIGFLWDILFCIVVVFNILHYFDLFHFNRLVMPIYCGADNKHLVYYGLNRIGLLAQRRMIGTVGNPNYNVIIFIFFAILYAPKPQWKLKNGIFFFLALAGIFACQSRTGLIAFALFYICHLIFTPLQWKTKIWQTVAVVGFFFILFLSNNLYYKAKIDNPNFEPYLETVLDGKAFSTNSWTARLDLWQMLIEKGSEHWFMGHSPDKQFFYEVEFDKRKIHADNEYVLFFYKYGSIGLLLYILLYILPSCRAVSKARNSVEARQMGFTAIAFATCAITNCPLSHPVTVLLFVYIIAQFYSVTPYYNLKKHVAERE